MDIEVLEQGVQENLPALEGFLKTIMLKKIKAEMTASSTADTAMVIEALKTGTVVIHSREQVFGTDIFIAFDENWIPQLSMAMLGVQENDINEITRDLIKEFSSQLLGTAQIALKEQDIQIDPGEAELVKSGQITNSVPDEDFFMAQVDVSGKFEIEGDEQPQLAMILSFAIPTDDKVQEVLGGETEAVEAEEEPDAGEDEEEVEDVDALIDELSEEESAETAAPKGGTGGGKGAGGEVAERDTSGMPEVEGQRVDFENFSPEMSAESDVEVRNLDLLKDVELDISVELGRKEVPLGDILHLVRGSVIELNKLAGEPVEVYANGHRIAEGEVVVIDEHFGVRITNLVSTRERIETLR